MVDISVDSLMVSPEGCSSYLRVYYEFYCSTCDRYEEKNSAFSNLGKYQIGCVDCRETTTLNLTYEAVLAHFSLHYNHDRELHAKVQLHLERMMGHPYEQAVLTTNDTGTNYWTLKFYCPREACFRLRGQTDQSCQGHEASR